MIPPYLEIEGQSEEMIAKMVSALGLRMCDVTTMDVDTVYNVEYGIQLDSIKDLRFNEEEFTLINRYKVNKELPV